MIRTTWSHSAESLPVPDCWRKKNKTKKTPKRWHMAQKETVWQTHLHAAETSGSVNDQKFFDEVSGEGKKRKSIHWIQAVFFVEVCHLSLFLSPKMEKPARCRAATDEHIPGERNLTVLRRGDGRSAGWVVTLWQSLNQKEREHSPDLPSCQHVWCGEEVRVIRVRPECQLSWGTESFWWTSPCLSQELSTVS